MMFRQKLHRLSPWVVALIFFFLLGSAYGQEKIVKKIIFVGPSLKDTAQLLGKIQLAVGKPFSEDVLARDIKRLYKTNQFYHIRTAVNPYDDGVKIDFILLERPQLSRVIISGRSAIDLADIAKKIRSKKGGYYNPAFVEKDKEALRNLYWKEGYFFIEISSKIRKLPKNKVELLFAIKEGPYLQLWDIYLEGNKHFTESEILKYIQSGYKMSYRHHPWYTAWLAYIGYALFSWITEDPYIESKFEDDLDILRRFYRSKGYFDVQVEYEKLEFNIHKEKAYVTLRIHEGPRYRVGKIFFKIDGKAKLDTQITKEEKIRFLRDKITLREGEYFSSEKLTEDIKKLQKEYHRRAYILAKGDFKMKFHYRERKVDIIYELEEKQKIKIETISFEGNTRTKDRVIRQYLTFFPGEWFNGDKLEKTGYKINSTRFFEGFDMKLEPGSEENSRNVVFKVKEGRTGSFIFGGGVASDFGFFGNFQFVQRNFDISDLPKSWSDFFSGNAFVGGGQLLSISLQPGIQRSSYNILFREPFLFGYPVILSLNGFFYNRDQFDYIEERLGGSVTLGRRLTDDLIFETTYQWQHIDIFDLRSNPPQDLLDVKGRNVLSSLTFGLTFDRLKIDRNFISYGGYRLGATYEYAGNFLLGDFDYSKAILQGRVYFWPWGSDELKHVLMFRTEAGWAESNSNTPNVPIFERFFLGGVRVMRGFAFRGIGPRVNDVALGGNLMFFGGAEYDFPIFGNFLRGVLFAEAGKIASDIDDVSKADFRISLGFGFRIRVPLFPAPIQLYFGFPMKKNVEDERQTFHFSLGFNF